MPLNLNQPQSEPILSRRRAVHELEPEGRDQFPKNDILIGLRQQGGPWRQRDPEEQRRIDRYRAAIRDYTPNHVSPQGWTYFDKREVIDIADAVLAKRDDHVTRDDMPQVVTVRHDPSKMVSTITLAVMKGADTLHVSQMISDTEMRRYNIDAIEVVDTCLASAYRQLAANWEQHQKHQRFGSYIKPVTH